MLEAGFFDRTTRGRLIVTGRDRVDLLHRLATNSLLGLERGKGAPTCFCTPKGRLIDWSVVLDRGEDLLVLSANPERLSGHIQQYTITEDVTVRNYMAIELIVCGPDAKRVLGVELEPWTFTDIRLADVSVQATRVEPLWDDAYAILAPDAVALRRLLAEQARLLEPRDVDELRIRSGIPAFPNEVNERHNPWEARLDASLSLTKGCYIGQEVIARLNTYKKVQRRLCGVTLTARVGNGDPLTKEEEVVGEASTVVGSRALAFVDTDLIEPGTQLDQGTVTEWPMG
ncbi:MAG: CAF17-like 4Fe-4S cluster assembly/insertion protein YgfZ [Planctomycetota bacterium]|jgi:folate-binding protein YgfZ